MSWPWWFTRSDAGTMAVVCVLALLYGGFTGTLGAGYVVGMILGTASFVVICWWANPRPEADQEPRGESREVTVEDAT